MSKNVFNKLYRNFFKRFFDVIFSFLALIVLSPLLLIIAILVRIKLGKPVIFKQERPGLKGNTFGMYKFRSMLPPQTREGNILTDSERLECIALGIDILSDEERLTRFGKILRMLSLDELPELLNIFRGEMSFVGPRPLSTIYLPYYSKEEMGRHDVNPGLTGLAQIYGRNSVSWSRRFELDLEYISKISLMLDLKILLLTVLILFKQEGIGQGSERPESFIDVRKREWELGKVQSKSSLNNGVDK